MENKFYFEEPTQVRVYDCMEDGDPCFMKGIAFEDKFICACCGMVVGIDELYSNADEDKFGGEVITPLGDWVDFSDYIMKYC